MKASRVLLLAFLVLIMALSLTGGRDRSIDLANALFEAGQLRVLDAEESQNLERFITAVLVTAGAKPVFAINEPYRKGRLNLYIVEGSRARGAAIARGNAAYVASSDIVFVDSLYFDFGNNRTFAAAENDLTGRLLTTMRVHAFFVLTHELGHRQLGHSWNWRGWFSSEGSHAREIEADDFAVAVLKQLYATDDSRDKSGIPAPVSSLTGVFGEEMTPLQRISDHFSYSVALLADDIFDSPFPILTASGTHPAYITRLRALITRLKADAQKSADEEAVRSLALSEAVTAATYKLVSMQPVEIELDNPVQHAYLDAHYLYLVGNDGHPIHRLALSSMRRGFQHRVQLPAPQRTATVRYAWAGQEGEALLLLRDGLLRQIDVASGETRSERDLRGELGDNSCIKRFLPAPGGSGAAYFSFCRKGHPHALRIGADGSLNSSDLRQLAAEAHKVLRGADVPAERIEVIALERDASTQPTLIYVLGDEAYALTLKAAFEPVALKLLALTAAELPAAVSNGEVSGTPGAIISDADGQPYYVKGTPIFRDIGVYDAQTRSDKAIASVDLSPGVDETLMEQRLDVHSSFCIGQNRIILNLADNGAYLMDFAARSLLPLRRHGFKAMEQIGANSQGDWIYFRKYEKRILLFRSDGNE